VIGISSIDFAQLSRFYLKTERESSLRNVVFINVNRTVLWTKTGRWIMSRNIIFVIINKNVLETWNNSKLFLNMEKADYVRKNAFREQNEYQEFSWRVKGGRLVRLTTLPPSVS
jgi:hypothetical protein